MLMERYAKHRRSICKTYRYSDYCTSSAEVLPDDDCLLVNYHHRICPELVSPLETRWIYHMNSADTEALAWHTKEHSDCKPSTHKGESNESRHLLRVWHTTLHTWHIHCSICICHMRRRRLCLFFGMPYILIQRSELILWSPHCNFRISVQFICSIC